MMRKVDVCVYGGTAAGCVAAITARQEGASVLLIEPSRWLGGMLSAGIKPEQDCSMPEAIGGLTGEHVFGLGDNPVDICAGFAKWIHGAGIEVIYEQRAGVVETEGGRIAAVRLDLAPPDTWGIPTPVAVPGATVQAGVFIDASYEGDLMALAGVGYRTGREGRAEYGEEPAGVGPPTNWTPLDPYVIPGEPASGLLPMIDDDHCLSLGAGDDYTQAYNFRFYATADPQRRVDLTVPDGYQASDYELVGRYVDHIIRDTENPLSVEERLSRIFPGWLNAGEYNYHRESLITSAPLGLSRRYQDGNWDERSQIWRRHVDYLRGLHHFLSTDPRVPATFRQKTASIGLDKTMYPETDGWPHQLYVRVARRLAGRYTLTHADVLNQTTVDDSIGLALYGVDTYPARRIAMPSPSADAATAATVGVATEGNMFLGGPMGTGQPYPVPYRSITPEADECTNLLVPVCLSATHIAYAATRMEPTFCVLGESAAVAATMAVAAGLRIQDVDPSELRIRLLERGQLTSWPVLAKRSPTPRWSR